MPRTRTLPGIDNPAFPYAQPEEVGLSSQKLNRLGDEITDWVANGDLVGAELLIVKDRQTVFHEAYGWADREERRPMERGSLFSIKSMSKPFMSVAILMLAEEGTLSLDDPVVRYIPTFAGDERTTIRHLLAHTSGYEGLGFNIGGFDTLGEWVASWASEPPTRPFGAYSYSDFNYAALGYIVEVVSGLAADAFIEERIIRPLGLEETYTSIAPDAPWAPRANSRYAWNDDGGDYDRYWSYRDPQGWAFYPAAWGLWSTAMDYAEFMTLWLNGGQYNGRRLLAEETVEEALRPHGLRDGRGMYGYGWELDGSAGPDGGPVVFYHGGFDGTLAMALPADGAMVIYLTQTRGGGDVHWYALQNRLAMLGLFAYPGPGMAWADEHDVAEVDISSEERARYVGMYRGAAPWAPDGPGLVVRVWEEEGRLHMGVGKAGARTDIRWHLVPTGNHRFAMGRYAGGRLDVIDPHATVHFAVDGGKAAALETVLGGQAEFSAERIYADKLAAQIEAERNRVRIDHIILEILETDGVEAARARHSALRTAAPDSVRFGEGLLNALGYRLLREERIEEAVAVFEMNAEAFPDEPNPHDSLGDAYRAASRLKDARRSYERAVELAEAAGDSRLATYRAKLDQVTNQLEKQDR